MKKEEEIRLLQDFLNNLNKPKDYEATKLKEKISKGEIKKDEIITDIVKRFNRAEEDGCFGCLKISPEEYGVIDSNEWIDIIEKAKEQTQVSIYRFNLEDDLNIYNFAYLIDDLGWTVNHSDADSEILYTLIDNNLILS